MKDWIVEFTERSSSAAINRLTAESSSLGDFVWFQLSIGSSATITMMLKPGDAHRIAQALESAESDRMRAEEKMAEARLDAADLIMVAQACIDWRHKA